MTCCNDNVQGHRLWTPRQCRSKQAISNARYWSRQSKKNHTWIKVMSWWSKTRCKQLLKWTHFHKLHSIFLKCNVLYIIHKLTITMQYVWNEEDHESRKSEIEYSHDVFGRPGCTNHMCDEQLSFTPRASFSPNEGCLWGSICIRKRHVNAQMDTRTTSSGHWPTQFVGIETCRGPTLARMHGLTDARVVSDISETVFKS